MGGSGEQEIREGCAVVDRGERGVRGQVRFVEQHERDGVAAQTISELEELVLVRDAEHNDRWDDASGMLERVLDGGVHGLCELSTGRQVRPDEDVHLLDRSFTLSGKHVGIMHNSREPVKRSDEDHRVRCHGRETHRRAGSVLGMLELVVADPRSSTGWPHPRCPVPRARREPPDDHDGRHD